MFHVILLLHRLPILSSMAKSLAVVVLCLCMLAGAGSADQQDRGDGAWQFSLDGSAEQGGHLVQELKDFHIKGYDSYDAGVVGVSGDGDDSSSFVYNARLQSRPKADVAPYDYSSSVSTLPEDFSAPASQFFPKQPAEKSTYVLGVPEEREEEEEGARPEYVYDARADGASFAGLDVQGDDVDQAVPAEDESKLPPWVYDARSGSSANLGEEASFTTTATESVSEGDWPVDGEQFQEQEDSSSYVYNARLQSRPEADAAPSRVSTLTEGFSAPASQFFPKQPAEKSTSYVLGVPEEREEEEEARPEYVYDASFAGLDVQGDDDQAEDESELPPWVYDARSGSPADLGEEASVTTTATESVQEEVHQGPVSYSTSASDRNGAFAFYDSHTGVASLAASRDTTTSASTSPVDGATKSQDAGCPNSYWAVHVDQWPAQVKTTTLISEAFGSDARKKSNLKMIFGTTTVLQALLDPREDPYSQLLRHGSAALLNAHARPAFALRPAQVALQLHAALASRAATAVQAQKFENENHAFGNNECN